MFILLKLILPGINAVVSLLTILTLFFRNKKSKIEISYIMLSANWLNWSLGVILTAFWGTALFGKYLFWLKNLSPFTMGPIWMIFSIYYTNSKLIHNKSRVCKFFIFILPSLILYIISITNEYHSFFFLYNYKSLSVVTYRWAFWIHMAVQYTYISLGLSMIIKYALKSRGYVRKSCFLIAAGNFVAQFLVIAYYISGLYKSFNDMDIVPDTFLVSMIFIFIASVKYRFLNILPMALPKIVLNMKEGIMIVDLEGKIATCNAAFNSMFSDFSVLAGESYAKDFSKGLLIVGSYSEDGKNVIHTIGEGGNSPLTGEVRLSEGVCVQINYQPLITNKELIGWVVSFYDISLQKALMKNLRENNEKLSEANEKLLNYAGIVEELVATRERNKFASDIHDSVGHSLSVLGALLEVCKLTYNEEPEKTYEKIETALNISKTALSGLRQAVITFSTPLFNGDNLLEALSSIIFNFELTGIKVDFTVHGKPEDSVNEEISIALLNICREALTNALKHGHAKQVNIILKFTKESISLFVFDEGKGCLELKKGTGLTGMERRVNTFGGKIHFGSGGEKGFSVHAEIPLSD